MSVWLTNLLKPNLGSVAGPVGTVAYNLFNPPVAQAIGPQSTNPALQPGTSVFAANAGLTSAQSPQTGMYPDITKNYSTVPTTSTPIRTSVPNYTNPISPPDYGAVQQQGQDYSSIIEQEYQNQMSQITGQEQGLRGQAETAGQTIGNEYASTQAQLGFEQGTKEQGVQSQVSTAEAGGKTAMQQARDLYRETQQSNIAQLSGLGISSSSVTEALAERLGVETARRIAGVTGSLNEVRLNATKELGRIKDYFQTQLTNLTREKATRMSEIQNSLMQGINQLNSARDMAATAKSRARVDLFANVQNIIANMKAQYDNYTYQLDLWARNKTSALTPISQGDFNDIFNTQMGNVQSQFSPSQFNVLPSYSVDKYGNTTGQINVEQRKPQEGDTKDINGETYYFDGSQWTKAL